MPDGPRKILDKRKSRSQEKSWAATIGGVSADGGLPDSRSLSSRDRLDLNRSEEDNLQKLLPLQH
jgi:hypothetical protein